MIGPENERAFFSPVPINRMQPFNRCTIQIGSGLIQKEQLALGSIGQKKSKPLLHPARVSFDGPMDSMSQTTSVDELLPAQIAEKTPLKLL